MSATQIPTAQVTSKSTHTPTAQERQPLWKHGVAAAVAASAATTLLAAIASAAGVSFATENGGESIPVLGFTELTLVFSLIGVAMAAVMARRARHPRSTFVRTAVILTVLSFVPDLTFGFDSGSAITLIALHVVTAVIVIPSLTRRLADER